MKPKILRCVALVLSGLIFGYATTYGEAAVANPLGSDQTALKLTIEVEKNAANSSSDISFVVVFHNDSTNNLLLNAGKMLGNGTQLWDSLEAELTNETGQQIPLRLHWGGTGVAGRIYFLGVPLRAESSYKLSVAPKDYYVGTGERLQPGKYEIRFLYHGRQSAYRDATQMPACWEGEVRSNTVKFEVLAK